MKSCLYECQLAHARFQPRAHAFSYRIFLFAIDLDDLPTLDRRLWLFSRDRLNLYAFHDGDYLPTSEPMHNGPDRCPVHAPGKFSQPAPAQRSGSDLKARVTTYLAERGVDLSEGRVVLVTLPRIAGYVFNPVSFYFCYNRAGDAVAAIAEVTNTFREIKPFFLPRRTEASPDSPFQSRQPKHFYVSPFSEVDVEFAFSLSLPGEQLNVRIDDYTNGRRTFASTLRGIRRELTPARLSWLCLKYPFLTLRVISLIHWHALLLWLKRVPWFAKSGRRADQRELYRPHASLV